MQLIVAEKPSVARDLARVLGLRGRGSGGRIEGDGRVITWCVGHLVELDEPAAYDARWKAWRLDTLPMLPERFKLRPVAASRDQLAVVRGLLRAARFTEVVNACDAGREGELIFRYVYELSGSRLPVRRLWISSMTDEAIRAGFAALRPGRDYDALADAARCRSEADWLVGLNATRAVTVRHRDGSRSSPLYSIGRVQTPTLAILVERERAIRDFRPRDYWELLGHFEAAGIRFSAPWSYRGVRRIGAQAVAEALLARAQDAAAQGALVEAVKDKRSHEPPPLLFDLTSLQRTANRRFGFSADRTLQLAQSLYERHKVLTYPRTDSRHLPSDLRGALPGLWRALASLAEYEPHVTPLLAAPPEVGKRVFDDGKVSDHHAIIPTDKPPRAGALDRDEARLHDLVVRRFIGAFHPDAVFALTEAVLRVGAAPDGAPEPPGGAGERGELPERAGRAGKGAAAAEGDDAPMLAELPPAPDRFVARGRVRVAPGWQAVAGLGEGEGDALELPPLARGERLAARCELQTKKTRPPPRHSEATLLGAMETAGREIEDEALRAAMKDSGLGTPATRASIIETLIKRGFVAREQKQLVPTAMGMALIAALPVPSLASAELTGQWEARLARVARGQEARADFMRDIAGYVREVVRAVSAAPVSRAMQEAAAPAQAGPPGDGRAPRRKPTRTSATAARRSTRRPMTGPQNASTPPRFQVDDLTCPSCRRGHLVTGKRGWGCSRWREHCQFVVWFEQGGKRVTRARLERLVRAWAAKDTPPAPA